MRGISKSEELAYLAGLVDGEGTITIARIQPRTPTSSVKYQPKLLLVNTDMRLIERCHEIAGCGIVYQSKADRTGAIPANWNPVHRYQAVAKQACEVIAEILPYLVAKARHAEVVLAMPTRSKNPHDRSAVAAQEEAFAAITALNRRGR